MRPANGRRYVRYRPAMHCLRCGILAWRSIQCRTEVANVCTTAAATPFGYSTCRSRAILVAGLLVYRRRRRSIEKLMFIYSDESANYIQLKSPGVVCVPRAAENDTRCLATCHRFAPQCVNEAAVQQQCVYKMYRIRSRRRSVRVWSRGSVCGMRTQFWNVEL